MPPDPLNVDESDYESSEDSDFAPEDVPPAATDDSSDSESEDENKDERSAQKPKTKKVKRKRTIEEAEDVGFENSGDEAIVEKGLKKQKKRAKKGEDDGDGGEGGFVKTRRMAALAPEEKRPLADTTTATVDVDALWVSMTSGARNTIDEDSIKSLGENNSTGANQSPNKGTNGTRPPDSSQTTAAFMPMSGSEPEPGDTITIRRTYNFAGKVHVEEKIVPRQSAEAQLWLQSQPGGKTPPKPSDPNISKPLRPPKKARRSIFEPITDPLPQRTDLKFGVNSTARNGAGGVGGGVAAKKLNTVEKSKMDWAGFVDKEGIKDELETAGKSKGAYLDQKEFLARVEDKREEEARRARQKG